MQRRNRRAGVEDHYHRRDGSQTKLHRGGEYPANRNCEGVGKRWRARYVNGAGKERTEAFDTDKGAERFLDGVTTLDVYSDLFDEDLDLVADRLDEGREKSTADYLRTVEAKKKGQDVDKTS